MAQQEVEMILLRHLASYLAMPVFIADSQGDLVYFNEAAEATLGRRFEETDQRPLSERLAAFNSSDEEGKPLPLDQLPIMIALTERRPTHRRLWIHGLDGIPRLIEATAFPLIGQADRFLGAVAIFWEIDR